MKDITFGVVGNAEVMQPYNWSYHASLSGRRYWLRFVKNYL